MNRLFYQALAVALALCALALTSCGNDVRFEQADENVFEQNIYIVPEVTVHSFYTTRKEVYIGVNEPIKIQAIFRLNKDVLDADIAASYYQSVLWILDGKKINIPNFRHTFQKSGQYDCILQTITRFGDTLIDTTHIFVDTPSSIALTSPRNGYNQAEPFSEEDIRLRWDITGIDPWETTICDVYGSNKLGELWKKSLKTVPCDEKISITGHLLPDEDVLAEYGINPTDTSITFYWGVIMTVMNFSGVQEMDTSDIFKFSTKLINTDSSILNIPIAYKHFRNQLPPDTRITIVNSKGDTLKQINRSSIVSTESIKLPAQTGLTVYMEEAYFSEYKADAFTVDIPEYSVITMDSVFFDDNIPPTVWPTKTEFVEGTDITFSLLDKGSGISRSRINVHFDDIFETTYDYVEPILSVSVPNYKQMRVYIRVSDNAGNQSPPVFWNVTPKNDMLYLDGPYMNAEELE